MITYFYKIVNSNNIPIYIGVTTRNINKRFVEHIRTKHLLFKNYKCIEIDRIVHPTISTIEEFRKEYKKVSKLEKFYIKEYKLNFNLLNISSGGEWGSSILYKISKKRFFNRYKTYQNFENIHKKGLKCKKWLTSWINNANKNNTKKFLRNWIYTNKISKVKVFLKSWIHYRTINNTKVFLRSWILVKNISNIKKWFKSWLNYKYKSKVKAFLFNWILHTSQNKTKVWLANWIINKKRNIIL